MAKPRSGNEQKVQKIKCPVCEQTVTVSAKYKQLADGDTCLVDFGCDLQGQCGIPSWDPCPFYVVYREKKKITKRR